MFFCPAGAVGFSPGFQPVSTGKHPKKRFTLKGREITWAKCVRLLPKRKRVFVRQRYNLPMALKPWAESCSPSGAINRRYADTPIRRYASPRQPKEIASL